MNGVVFVMVNSKLARKKKVRREPEIEDLISDSEFVSGDEEVVVHVDEYLEEDVCDPNFNRMEMEEVSIFKDVPDNDGDEVEKGQEVDGGGGGKGKEVDGGGEDGVGGKDVDGDEEGAREDGEDGGGEDQDEDDEGEDDFNASKYL